MLILAAMLFALVPPSWAALVFLLPPFPGLFGRQAVLPGLFFALWAGVAAALWAFYPVLHGPMALAGAGLILVLIRGQLIVSVAQGSVPPGSLSFAKGVRALARRDFYQREFGRYGPIFKSSQFGAPVICVAGLERICQLLRTHADQLGPSPLAFSQGLQGNFLRYMNSEAHSFYGGLFRRAMVGQASPALDVCLHEKAQSMLVGLSRSGCISVNALLHRFSQECLDVMLFGFTANDAIGQRFAELSEGFGRSSIGRVMSGSDRMQLHQLIRLLDIQLSRLRSNPAPGQPVLLKLLQLDSTMPDRVCLENLVFMRKIAASDMASLLLWLLYHWGMQTEISAHIKSMEAAQKAMALDAFLAETLRLSQSEYIYRCVHQEFNFEGFVFPRGWLVRCCIWETHRSARELPGPSEFRLRLNRNSYDNGHYAPFGVDRHACNGADLCNAISRAFLKALSNGISVELKHSEPFQRQMRHWSHWGPNRAMTALLTLSS